MSLAHGHRGTKWEADLHYKPAFAINWGCTALPPRAAVQMTLKSKFSIQTASYISVPLLATDGWWVDDSLVLYTAEIGPLQYRLSNRSSNLRVLTDASANNCYADPTTIIARFRTIPVLSHSLLQHRLHPQPSSQCAPAATQNIQPEAPVYTLLGWTEASASVFCSSSAWDVVASPQICRTHGWFSWNEQEQIRNHESWPWHQLCDFRKTFSVKPREAITCTPEDLTAAHSAGSKALHHNFSFFIYSFTSFLSLCYLSFSSFLFLSASHQIFPIMCYTLWQKLETQWWAR